MMDLDNEKWGTLLGWPDADNIPLMEMLQDPMGNGEFDTSRGFASFPFQISR
jgi:hypothetical protein